MTAEPVPSALAECEAVIERGLASFVEVGNALMRIRDERLYRGSHATFEGYCRERWGWGRAYVNRQVAAAEVAGILAPIGAIRAESQARELVPLRAQPEIVREVWGEIVERSEREETPITAAVIGAAVRMRIRGMAAESEAAIQTASAGWSDDLRAAHSPEMTRQRGEFRRLIHDIAALPDPWAYAAAHRRYLPADYSAEVTAAIAWLDAFRAGLIVLEA